MQGNTIQASQYFPDASSVWDGPYTFTVGPSTELTWSDSGYDIDLGDTWIRFNFYDAGFAVASFNGWKFTDLNDTIAPFLSFTINPTSTAGTPTELSFDSNTLSVNLAGYVPATNTFLLLDVNQSAVPEPGTMLLTGAMLAGGITLIRRRK